MITTARSTAVAIVIMLAALWMASGPQSIVYLLIFSLAVAPGFPVGFLLFGRRHAAGWICGALIGYGLTQLALWLVIVTGLASGLTFVVAWMLLSAVTTLLARGVPSGPLVALPEWRRADTKALLLVLLLVPILMVPPYRNLGRADETGNRYYRAYFTADFLWHSALAHELGNFSLPPRNPYMAPRPMNYYWTYFLLPASVARLAPDGLQDVEKCLKTNAMMAGLLMVGVLFLLVRTAVGSPLAAATAVGLAVVAASAEGAYEIVTLWRQGRPLSGLLDTNIDAITAWRFGGLRVDNIPRSLWYTPQHTTSIALGLVGLLIASAGGVGARPLAIVAAGIALGLSTTMNPVLGAVCSMMYGVCVAADAFARRGLWRRIPLHVLAAVPVVLAVAWGSASHVMDGAGSALDFGFHGFSRHAPFVTLMLSLGPILLPAAIGLAFARGASARPMFIGVSGVVLGLFLLYFVRISEASWVGFRAGQILLVSIPILLAGTLERIGKRAATVLAVSIAIAGAPTTIVDTWNAQDIGNRRPGPQFRWTLWTTPAQQEAFRWLRQHTPSTAVVQMEPMIRAREHWTLIPSFAGRRMAAGLPISLLPLPEYEERSQLVRTAFSTLHADEAWDVLRRLRIDYIYIDPEDRAAYGQSLAKFDRNADRFERVFGNGEVTIYRVR
jgi:hypothetical protein